VVPRREGVGHVSNAVEVGSGNTTAPSPLDPLVDEGPQAEPLCPTLAIAWSSSQPWRVGEVAVFATSTRVFLGRGDDSSGKRVQFGRQSPIHPFAPEPLEGRTLSRDQLAVRVVPEGLEVRVLGTCPTFVNGTPVTHAVLKPGDTLLCQMELLLYCTTRRVAIAPPRFLDLTVARRFGEPDRLGIVGESPATWHLRDELARAAHGRTHVLVHGETGTGKELAALAVHRLSERAAGPLVARNAATLPPGLIDAELFGCAKDYPNAGMPARQGLFGEADLGTLFLDELAELPLDLQPHLLRVLDSGEYHRLGDTMRRRADVRLVGATNRAPSSLRHDLRERFKAKIRVPPLRERREDIPLLVRHLLLRQAKESPEVAERFVERWPAGGRGARVDARLIEDLLHLPLAANVRELDRLLWAAMGASPGDTVRRLLGVDRQAEATVVSPPPRFGDRRVGGEPHGENFRVGAGQEAEAEDLLVGLMPPSAEQILAALHEERGSMTRAAKVLGLPSRYALYRLMQRLGIKKQDVA
jgi:DNA-binding NtrC family response regulator